MAAIEVSDLCRTYRTHVGILRRRRTDVEALAGISFQVERGELFGLLGPNGAGKTTTIKILTTLLLPSSGSARVLGFDPAREPGEIRRRVGHVFGGDRGLYDRLSGLDNLRYFADLYRVPVREKRARIDHLLELVGLRGRSGSGSRPTRAGCGSGCISRADCSTTPRCCSSTSRRSGSIPSARARSGRRSPACVTRARRCS